jgi:hypothetical protein
LRPIDDIVVKTRKADDLVSDLRIAFDCLQANGVKLNPEKCVFRVSRGKLLGYIVSQWGIEPNREKVAALDRMDLIRDLNGVQKVLGCLAALSRFISQLGKKVLPLYRLLKKHGRFSWTVEAQEALDKLKAMLAHTPILTPPQNGEPLYLYVAATTQVVSAIIVVERTEEGHTLPVQRLVYYISEVLFETKARYPQVQKLLYAVVLARRKLQHYLEAHPVTVVSSFRWGRSSVTRMRRAGLPSRLWNSWARRLPMRRARQSSPRSWRISSLSGRIRSCHCCKSRPSAGPSTSTGQ